MLANSSQQQIHVKFPVVAHSSHRWNGPCSDMDSVRHLAACSDEART